MRHLALLVERFDGGADGTFEVASGLERLVGEMVALDVAPGPLDVVQLGRISWQPLDGNPGPGRQGGAAGVDGSTPSQSYHPCVGQEKPA